MPRGRRRAACVVGRSDIYGGGRSGLLRHQSGGRVQPADKNGAGGRVHAVGRWQVQLQGGRLRDRPEQKVPGRADRQGAQRAHGGVHERVRAVQHGRVLLPGRAQQAEHVQEQLVAGQLSGHLQVGLSERVQLRVRRHHQHVHVPRPPVRQLRHHVLPLNRLEPITYYKLQ